MAVLNNETSQKEHSMFIKLIKLLGVFLCCAVLGIVLRCIISEICVSLGVNIKSIKSFRANFINFSVTICTPIWYLWFVDKKLGGKIGSSFSLCPVSFLITPSLVVFRLIYYFLIGNDRLHLLPTRLKQWAFLQGGDLYRKSTQALDHLNCLSDLFWEGILPFIIIAGIGEELIFRGILQNIFLQKTKKPWVAIVMTSILFTMTHGSLYHSIDIFLMGLLLGIIYYITNNIYMAIFAHMLNNGIIVLVMYFFKDSLFMDLDSAIQKLSIWQVTLGITICMCCIFLFLKKLIVIQHNRCAAST